MIYPFFLNEWMKYEKREKFVTKLLDQKEYIIRIRNLNQALNHKIAFNLLKKLG